MDQTKVSSAIWPRCARKQTDWRTQWLHCLKQGMFRPGKMSPGKTWNLKNKSNLYKGINQIMNSTMFFKWIRVNWCDRVIQNCKVWNPFYCKEYACFFLANIKSHLDIYRVCVKGIYSGIIACHVHFLLTWSPNRVDSLICLIKRFLSVG